MWKLNRMKPAPADTLTLYDHPCPACGLADYLPLLGNAYGKLLECLNCHAQWLEARLLNKGYTSGKGRG